MKAFLVPTFIAAGLALAGCESDMPPPARTDNALQRGLRGEGQLVQPDRSGDPIIRETARETPREAARDTVPPSL